MPTVVSVGDCTIVVIPNLIFIFSVDVVCMSVCLYVCMCVYNMYVLCK